MSGGFADILKSMEDSSLRHLAAKVPSWAGHSLELPSSLNLQQCSGESAARYKASLVPAGARVADLTGGLGVDSWAFSLRASAVWYNERDGVLLEAVKRNFAALGVSGLVFNGYDISLSDSAWVDSLRSFAPDVIYLDPARRNAAGRKVFLLEDCSPDVVALMPLLLEIASLVIVKVSPMADLTMLQRRLAGWLSELHVVGADGECKELLCICRGAAHASAGTEGPATSVLAVSAAGGCGLRPSNAGPSSPSSAIVCGTASMKSSVSVVLAEDGYVFGGIRPESAERSETPVGPSVSADASCGGTKTLLLFVPSAAMVKSGLGPGMGMIGYDEELALFGKFYEVVENLPFASSQLKELGKRWPQAEVTAKGVQLSSEELRTRMKIKPGGPIHIFACVINGDRRLLVCRHYNDN